MDKLTFNLPGGITLDVSSVEDAVSFAQQLSKANGTPKPRSTPEPTERAGEAKAQASKSVVAFARILVQHPSGIKNSVIASTLGLTDSKGIGPKVSGFARLLIRLGTTKEKSLLQRTDDSGEKTMRLSPEAIELLRKEGIS